MKNMPQNKKSSVILKKSSFSSLSYQRERKDFSSESSSHRSFFSRWFLFFIFTFCLSTIFLISNGFAQSKNAQKISGGDPKAKKGGTFVYENYEPSHLNPFTYRDIGAIEILNRYVFESLLDSDIITGEDIPWLAKSWSISKDGKEFTFTLDERAKWFDGKPVSAEDVKFSFEVYKMPGVLNPLRKTQVDAIEKIEIIKPWVIKFFAKEKNFNCFEFISSLLIVPKHLYFKEDSQKMMDHEWIRQPRGSGPYMVKAFNKGDRTILERNPNYWANVLPQNTGAYNFDQIIIRFIRDPQVAFESLKKGDIDYMLVRVGNIELWRQTKSDKAFLSGKLLALEVSSQLQEGFAFIGFNLKNELFADKKIRKALTMAINREEIIQKSLDGSAVVPRGPLYSYVNFNGKFSPLKYDPKSARDELESLGWKDTDKDYILDKNGKKFTFNVLVPNPRIEKEMLFIQDYLKKIGIQMNVKRLEYSTWQQLQDERKFEALSNGRIRNVRAKNIDPFAEWHSSNAKPGLKNFYSYSNPEVDALIEKGVQEFDFKKRKLLFDKVNDIIADDHVMIQYSESKFLNHAVSSRLVLPTYKGKHWYPYDLGIKYWFEK